MASSADPQMAALTEKLLRKKRAQQFQDTVTPQPRPADQYQYSDQAAQRAIRQRIPVPVEQRPLPTRVTPPGVPITPPSILAPTPAYPTSPEPGSPDAAANPMAVSTLAERQRIRELQNARMRLSESGTFAERSAPEHVAQLQDVRAQLERARTAQAPIAQPQSPDTINANRDTLRRQLILDASRTGNVGEVGAAQRDLSRLTPDQAAEIQARQQQARAQQIAHQTEARAGVGKDQAQYAADQAAQMQIREAARQQTVEAANANVALEKQRGQGDPEMIAKLAEARRIEAAAKREEAAYSGQGPTTPEAGAVAAGRREGVTQRYGIDDKFTEALHTDFQDLVGAMSDLSSGKVAGGYFGGAEGFAQKTRNILGRINALEDASQTDPDITKQIASTIYYSLRPKPDASGRFTSGVVGGGIFPLIGPIIGTLGMNQRTRAETAQNLNLIEAKLRRLAGIQGE